MLDAAQMLVSTKHGSNLAGDVMRGSDEFERICDGGRCNFIFSSCC